VGRNWFQAFPFEFNLYRYTAFELKNLAELPLYLPLGLLCGATVGLCTLNQVDP
jgi:hypothetical protein